MMCMDCKNEKARTNSMLFMGDTLNINRQVKCQWTEKINYTNSKHKKAGVAMLLH